MNKKLFLCGLVTYTGLLLAQPYGHTSYPNSSKLMTGQQTNINSTGFLMAGLFTPAGGGWVPSITKTSSGGAYVGSPTEFRKGYHFMRTGLNNCTPGSNFVANMVGISVIETNAGAMGQWYALASVFDDGVIFSTLNSSGNPIATSLYKFPRPANDLNQPTLIEDPNFAGQFYICGKYDSTMFVIKTNLNGTVLWSHYYNAGGGMIEPRDMIISAHNNNLIIVGHVTPAAQFNTASDCFFLELDPLNGNINKFVDYTNTPCNWFNSVKNSYYMGNGAGYVVGGYSDYFQNSGSALAMKLDLNGGIIWNTLIDGAMPGVFTNEILDITERLNSLNNYEYYAVARSVIISQQSDIISVFKLDNTGMPVSGNSAFNYSGPVGLPLTGKKIDFQNTPGLDQGLHVYASNGNSFYLLASYFNGYTGCNENFNSPITESGPQDTYPWIAKYGSFSQCPNQLLIPYQMNYTPNLICSNSSISSGSNQKVTGMDELNALPNLNVFPNPSHGEYNFEANSSGTMKIVNALGEIMYVRAFEPGQIKINIETLPSGIYTLLLKDNSGSNSTKIIKE